MRRLLLLALCLAGCGTAVQEIDCSAVCARDSDCLRGGDVCKGGICVAPGVDASRCPTPGTSSSASSSSSGSTGGGSGSTGGSGWVLSGGLTTLAGSGPTGSPLVLVHRGLVPATTNACSATLCLRGGIVP